MEAATDITKKIRIIPNDHSAEDNILTGMIVSTGFLKEIIPMFNPSFMVVPYTQAVSKWCIDYYNQYSKAPGMHIKDIFQKWKISNSDTDYADMLAGFLSKLSKKYEEHVGDWPNDEYLLDQAKGYINKRRLESLKSDINSLLGQDRTSDAIKLVNDFQQQQSKSNNLVAHLSDIAVSSSEFLKQDIKPPAKIIKPIISKGGLTMIYGEAGIGKTFLVDAIALGVTRENYAELSIGPWEFRSQCGVLLVDGEMSEGEIHDRLTQLAGPLGAECPDHPLKIISANALGRMHQEQMNLAKKEWRDAITQYLLDNPQLKILILDNIASLTPGIDENTKNEWDPINQWLLSLRHMDKAVILVHHANKARAQRGTSGRSDNLDTVIKLTRPPDYDPNLDGAYFKIEIEKGRSMKSGEKAPFTLRIREHEENPKWQTWCAGSVANAKGNKKMIVEALLLDGKWRQAEIHKKGIASKSYVSETMTDLRNRKLIDSSGRKTESGKKYLTNMSMNMEELYEDGM